MYQCRKCLLHACLRGRVGGTRNVRARARIGATFLASREAVKAMLAAADDIAADGGASCSCCGR
jgi:hypothetical protein